MRYNQLSEVRTWKRYQGRSRSCLITDASPEQPSRGLAIEAEAEWGIVWTGRSEVFGGYYVRIDAPDGDHWLGEDSWSLQAALAAANEIALQSGWALVAVGLTRDWSESGLSENTSFGYVIGIDHAVHMLEPPRQIEG